MEAKIITSYEIIEWMTTNNVTLKDHLKVLLQEYKERLLIEEDIYMNPQMIILKRLVRKDPAFERLFLDEKTSNYISFNENFNYENFQIHPNFGNTPIDYNSSIVENNQKIIVPDITSEIT